MRLLLLQVWIIACNIRREDYMSAYWCVSFSPSLFLFLARVLHQQRVSVCEVCQGLFPHSAISFSKLKVKSNRLCVCCGYTSYYRNAYFCRIDRGEEQRERDFFVHRLRKSRLAKLIVRLKTSIKEFNITKRLNIDAKLCFVLLLPIIYIFSECDASHAIAQSNGPDLYLFDPHLLSVFQIKMTTFRQSKRQ